MIEYWFLETNRASLQKNLRFANPRDIVLNRLVYLSDLQRNRNKLVIPLEDLSFTISGKPSARIRTDFCDIGELDRLS